ncbi:MAG: sel1 repeat family protein [Proteobacteria bacterium]|nr:sel1 repeat family protein [Pseudomonadota bacterium]MBU4354082.1 sel1 repeat family protein [Pseudomonadota bacterium]
MGPAVGRNSKIGMNPFRAYHGVNMLRDLTILFLFGALVLSGAGCATTNSDGTRSTAISTAGGALAVAANQGDAEAQNNLGVMYAKGQGVPQDYTEAARWYRKAADQGHAVPQFNLGGLYEKGHGVTQDYVEAARWLRKAADQGYAAAQNNLGFLYDKGQGVPQDYAEAAKWYRKAADQGDAAAKRNLDVLNRRGQGGPGLV